MSSASAALKTARAESCLREILRVASAGQISIGTAGVLINGVHDRAALLTALREIKVKAIEAEVLLRSIETREVLSS
jgi:hypothetical protein